MLYFIGILKEVDQLKKEKIYYRLFDSSDKSKQDITETQLKTALKNDDIVVSNLGIDENDNIIGTCGKLDRYAVLIYPIDVLKQRPIVIIARKNNKYTVVDIMGNCAVMDYKEAVIYCENVGIANAKVVNRGNKKVLSAISGTFETSGGGRLSDEIDEYYNKCLKLREEGRLNREQLSMLEKIEKDYLKKMHTLKMKEQRGLTGAIDVAKVTPIINKLVAIETEIEDRVISSEVKSLKEKLSESKGRYRALLTQGIQDEKIPNSIKKVKMDFDRSDELYNDCLINSEEYLRRLDILKRRVDIVNDWIVDNYPVPGGLANA